MTPSPGITKRTRNLFAHDGTPPLPQSKSFFFFKVHLMLLGSGELSLFGSSIRCTTEGHCYCFIKSGGPHRQPQQNGSQGRGASHKMGCVQVQSGCTQHSQVVILRQRKGQDSSQIRKQNKTCAQYMRTSLEAPPQYSQCQDNCHFCSAERVMCVTFCFHPLPAPIKKAGFGKDSLAILFHSETETVSL